MKVDLKSGRVATIEKYRWKHLLMGQAAGVRVALHDVCINLIRAGLTKARLVST